MSNQIETSFQVQLDNRDRATALARLILVFPVFHGLGGGPSLACCGPLSFTRTTSTASFLECFFLLNVEEGRGVLPPDEAIEGGRVVLAPDEAVPVVKSMGEKTT